MLRLVLFDLGGTLLELDKARELWRLLLDDGFELPYERVDYAFQRAFRFFMRNRPHLWHSGAELRDRAILNHVLRDLQLRVNAETLRRAVKRSDRWRPFPDAHAALAALRAVGLGTGLITNWDRSARRVLAEFDLAGRLDPVVVSSEVGCEKPDPDIFRVALCQAGAAPAETLFVGDNYWDDVVGARSAGIDAVVVDRRPERDAPAYDCPVVTSLIDLTALLLPLGHAAGD